MSCVTAPAVQCKPVEGRESFWQSRQEYQIQTNTGIFTQLHCAAFIWRPCGRAQVPKMKLFLVLLLEN